MTKINWWQNSKAKIVWQNSTNQICDKTKKNSNLEKDQVLKLWQNSKTQIVKNFKKKNGTKIKTEIVTKSKTLIVAKLKNSNCDSSNSDSSDSSSNSDIF